MADRFDHFTERARGVLTFAQEEAQRLGHDIDPEHLALGLIREGYGLATKILANLGVDLNKLRSEIELAMNKEDWPKTSKIGLTPRANRTLELAVEEAHRLNHHYIGTEHLLLALVRENGGIAAEVLESLGVNLEKVREEVDKILSISFRPLSSEQAVEKLTEKLKTFTPLYDKIQVDLSNLDLSEKIENLIPLAEARSARELYYRFLSLRDEIGTVLAPMAAERLFPITPKEIRLRKFIVILDALDAFNNAKESED